LLALRGVDCDRVLRALRLDGVHVVARVVRDVILIDLRTVAPGDVVRLAEAVRRAVNV
jgi:hypothetical protein